MDIKIYYIFHSGILFETEDSYLLIDYYLGDLPNFDKKTYIMASHEHKDHFNPDILDFQGDITYILSDDIKITANKNSKDINYVSPDNTYSFGDIKIETYGSTDQGISMLINLDGKNIYHSGDLNLWIWPEDSTEEIKQMNEDFEREVNKLQGKDIDIAMFPVDPRLKERALGGPRYFLDRVKPEIFIPIHMFRDNSFAKDLEKEFPGVKFLIANNRNEELI